MRAKPQSSVQQDRHRLRAVVRAHQRTTATSSRPNGCIRWSRTGVSPRDRSLTSAILSRAERPEPAEPASKLMATISIEQNTAVRSIVVRFCADAFIKNCQNRKLRMWFCVFTTLGRFEPAVTRYNTYGAKPLHLIPVMTIAPLIDHHWPINRPPMTAAIDQKLKHGRRRCALHSRSQRVADPAALFNREEWPADPRRWQTRHPDAIYPSAQRRER
jgi:hypothetical protein